MRARIRHLFQIGIGFGLLASKPATAFEVDFFFEPPIIRGEVGLGPVIINDPNANTGLLDGFSVGAHTTPIQETPAGEALKWIQQGEWVKAIQAIESLKADDPRMVQDGSGVLRPLGSFKSALITAMPDEGRAAFRKLNGPAAQTKLKRARAHTTPDQQADAYAAIIIGYPLCNASAQAARALGDIRFEQGRFEEAAELYRFCAQHPATTADDASLIARRLISQARAAQWDLFDQLATYASFRHPDATVRLGGQGVKVQSLIRQLTSLRADDAGAPIVTIDGPTLALPVADDNLFQSPAIEPKQYSLLKALAKQNNLDSVFDGIVRPELASDGDRLFQLALGEVSRLDPDTGSVLWQHRPNLKDNQQQPLVSNIRQLAYGYHQSLVIAGDTLLAVIPHPHNTQQSTIKAFNAETGELRWNGQKNAGQDTYQNIVGKPLVVGDRVYAISQRRGNPEVRLAAIHLKTGQPVMSIKLGNAANDARMGTPAEFSPRLAMGQSLLFVQTNNGALIAIDPEKKTIAWAMSQQINPSVMGMLTHHRAVPQQNMINRAGEVVAQDGYVFAKDTRTRHLHALREHDAALLWSAEVEPTASIVHADDRHAYVLGKQLTAYDLKTGKRAWWTPHAGKESGQPAFTHDTCLIAGDQRTCLIDLSTGKLTDYSEENPTAARLLLHSDRVIRQANNRISAQRLTP